MISFIVTKSGVVVVDGSLLAQGLTNLAGAEAKYGLYTLDSLAPVAETYLEGDAWISIAQSVESGDLNETVKEVLSSIFGGAVAAYTYTTTGSASAAVTADILSGEAFKFIYDEISKTAANNDELQRFLAQFFDVIGIFNPVEWQKHISELTGNFFTSATAATQPIYYDPLALDLDGDGIETVGLNGYDSVLFDHNADGVKTAGGWVAADDGLLALDLNGNGQIDNGRELFGIDYLKQNGQLAGDGFDALRDLDANADNVFDANDAQFSNVRVWRDLNQDGISQADELYTLEQLDIQSIALNAVQQTVNLGNGNQQTASAIYTRTDGSTGSAGNLDFSQNSFYRSFTDAIDTTGFEALPDMRGAGQVRNLREAAALSPVLAQLITDFAAADRAGQLALLDPILKAWSDTSTLATTFTGAYDGHGLTVNGLPAAGTADRQAWENKISLLKHIDDCTFNAPAANDETWRMAA